MTTPSELRAARRAGVEAGDETRWIDGLRRNDPQAAGQLHALLLRAARAEAARRAAGRPVGGSELDDLVYQAAADAMLAVLSKLDTFRGESRFTTWAYKFVIFEVSSKLTRHFWNRPAEPLDEQQWERLPDRFGFGPQEIVEAADLLAAVRRVVENDLTDRQRDAFVAVVVQGVPLDVLVERWSTNRNAVYKAVFDARQGIRNALVAAGHLSSATSPKRAVTT